MADPVRRLRLPLRDRPAFYWVAIALAVVVVSFAVLLTKIHTESNQRTKQLQDVICGVYVPIAQTHLPITTSALGKTIVLATHHGALKLHCPGIKP
jgi:hypothetical protein